jgi:hypothetical protein
MVAATPIITARASLDITKQGVAINVELSRGNVPPPRSLESIMVYLPSLVK